MEWERRDAVITGEGGVVFEQRGVEVPAQWSQMATNVVASKYFRGALGSPERETSVKQLVHRVAHTIAEWGERDGYFVTSEDAALFEERLSQLMLEQKACFNSPVWFNVGVEDDPQASACFILTVDDTMESILEWIRQEGMIFKGGSGSGVNVSHIRAENELLSHGGKASGPLSFMKVADANAGAIKSGGETRRAARMVVMDVDHPDILAFIQAKVTEEHKARVLKDAGYSGGIEGEAYATVAHQNANHSVRLTNAFLQCVDRDGEWSTTYRISRTSAETYKARHLFHKLCEATHTCGDPGVQFTDTINEWHTCKTTGPIESSNPCGEYIFLNQSACNLASLNLLSFLLPDNTFDRTAFCWAVDLLITAQDILVSRASYPTEEIAHNSERFRPLGLGYANLGALLMTVGLPYDSEEGRDYAASITALMTGRAYARSAELARLKGPFDGYRANAVDMCEVIEHHRGALKFNSDIWDAAHEEWDNAWNWSKGFGFRNAQVTLLAPTGTIAFMMDCATTGIEPDVSLVKTKMLVGGGKLQYVNTAVPRALRNLGYNDDVIASAEQYVLAHNTLEGLVTSDHEAIFDCAFPPSPGGRSIHWKGHVKMLGAVQPFLSGAISKTINLPTSATVKDVEEAYLMGWQLGVKSMAVYRDGCKSAQPLLIGVDPAQRGMDHTALVSNDGSFSIHRHRLPDERPAMTHKFNVAGHEGYITVGLYNDGSPGEVFIRIAKQGSVVSGLLDTVGVMTSLLLQYGVPLSIMSTKLIGTRFEPSGFTTNSDIPIAKSIIDYLFRWLTLKFGAVIESEFRPMTDAPTCPECGTLMTSRNGSCFGCLNCGSTNGCS